jgi:predicted RNA-binding Zn ribbon-like protein
VQTPETIKLLGGSLCVDFVNTVDYDGDEPLPEHDALVDADAVSRWGRRVGVWAGEDVGGDGEGARLAAAELAALRELRPRLRALLTAEAGDAAPGDLAAIAGAYAQAVAAAHLSPAPHRLDWPQDDLRRVRFAVVADAFALLTDPERLARVHVCPGRRCGWLFYDTSGRRRWCSMQTCGSRAKMRRMYARRQQA